MYLWLALIRLLNDTLYMYTYVYTISQNMIYCNMHNAENYENVDVQQLQTHLYTCGCDFLNKKMY